MNTWGKQIRQAWDALSVADLGETIDPGEMTRRLDNREAAPARPVLQATPAPRRLIVLAVKGQVLAPALDYVRDAAARLDADVAVLEAAAAPALPSMPAPPAATGTAIRSNGVTVREHRLDGDFEAGLRQFLRRHPQAIFVVIGDATRPGDPFPLLPVPVVVVTEIVRADAGSAS